MIGDVKPRRLWIGADIHTGSSGSPGGTRRLQMKIFAVRLDGDKLRRRSLGVRITPTQQFPQEQTDVIPATPEGRCRPSRCGRGKSENENNNVLKTQGYHLEPNFGHGQPSLSATMLSLNLWAFRFHPGLEWSDEKYVVRRRKHFWTA